LRELLFLTLANHLPRLALFDSLRGVIYRLAGFQIRGRCTIWGLLTIRPIGGAKNIQIGAGRGGKTQPIVVEDEVWIGAGAIITQGVTIGRGSVVAAGAVVTADVEAQTLVGGVPARLIRRLDASNGGQAGS